MLCPVHVVSKLGPPSSTTAGLHSRHALLPLAWGTPFASPPLNMNSTLIAQTAYMEPGVWTIAVLCLTVEGCCHAGCTRRTSEH